MNCIFANTIYTGKSIVSNRYLVFKGQQITGISKTAKGDLLGRFDVLTPAFVDPHSHIGMDRSGEPSAEGEANDHHDSILAITDALDSVQMDDKAFKDAVEAGVLYSCVVPGSGNIIGGESAVIRNFAGDSTGALIGRAGLKAAFGYNPMSNFSWKGKRPTTRMGAIAILRGKLEEVRQNGGRF
jgi:imidazolonepropionase-like amidohydrolase